MDDDVSPEEMHALLAVERGGGEVVADERRDRANVLGGAGAHHHHDLRRDRLGAKVAPLVR